MRILCLYFLSALLFLKCDGATVLVDGVSDWKDPIATFGDTIIFRHKNHYNLYIFRTEQAFDLCNFTQASLLTSPNSTSYTWHPSRPGFFYFSFNNGTSIPCKEGQKLAVKVNPPAVPPVMVAPEPTPGGMVSSSPSYPWPFQPREKSGLSPTPGPSSSSSPAPDDKGGSSIPFINSNPAVPLPSGEVDSATILPLPTTASRAPSQDVQLMGLLAVFVPLCYAIIFLQ